VADATELRETFTRYAGMIEALLKPPGAAAATSSFAAESASAVQVERGIVLARPDDVASVERLIELSSSPRLVDLAVIDASGSHRPVYRPLLVYAWLSAFRRSYETLPRDQFGRWDEALRSWCDLLEAQLDVINPTDTGTPASRGAAAAEAAWSALALHLAGKIFIRDAWTDLASDTFGRLSRGQRESGEFLVAAPSEAPEPRWYHELTLLHAAASYAVQAEDRTVARAVARSADFMSREVQPDHATSQPWGLFAFVWNWASRPLADQVLHTATVQSARARLDGVSLILLADALYCLRLFL
jgi:hypothetical protein